MAPEFLPRPGVQGPDSRPILAVGAHEQRSLRGVEAGYALEGHLPGLLPGPAAQGVDAVLCAGVGVARGEVDVPFVGGEESYLSLARVVLGPVAPEFGGEHRVPCCENVLDGVGALGGPEALPGGGVQGVDPSLSCVHTFSPVATETVNASPGRVARQRRPSPEARSRRFLALQTQRFSPVAASTPSR